MVAKKTYSIFVFISISVIGVFAVSNYSAEDALDAYHLGYSTGHAHGIYDETHSRPRENPYLNLPKLDSKKHSFTEADIKQSYNNGYSDGYEDGYRLAFQNTTELDLAPGVVQSPIPSNPIAPHPGSSSGFWHGGRTGTSATPPSGGMED